MWRGLVEAGGNDAAEWAVSIIHRPVGGMSTQIFRAVLG